MPEFTEFRKRCLHCCGLGYSAGPYSHQLALDLLVDAADAARFNEDEARNLYRLAAKYEDSTADQLEQDQKGRRLDKVPWTAAVHRHNAIYLRALADQETLTIAQRRVVRTQLKVTRSTTSPMALSFVKDAPV